MRTSAVLLVVSNVGAALLFQDRHADANGEETIYRFEAKATTTASPIEQAKAVKVATVWAAEYYGIANLTVANTQERSIPIHYWLIAFTAPAQSKGGAYCSIVLPDGSVVEPKVSRQNLTASANPIDVTKDTELQAPIKGLEIHGEVIFEYGWGKGLRNYGPYARTPPGTFHLRLHGQRRNGGNFTTEAQRTRRGQNIKNEAAAVHQSRLTFVAFETFLLNFPFLRALGVSVVKFILRSLCLSAESRAVFDD